MMAKKLNMPLEHVMHTPPHILMAKLQKAEAAAEENEEK
ncbi:YycC family protein [Alkalicoccus daliensis]